MNKQQGFTLIEMIIVTVITLIILAIGVPMYRQYGVQASENQTQVKMQQLAVELNRWRSNNLTYKGFLPKKSSGQTIIYSYDAANQNIYVPNANKMKYTITIVNGISPYVSLLEADRSAVTWRMFAQPNAELKDMGAVNFLLTSNGLQCKGINLTLTSEDCTGAKSW